ncbi:MAG: hypothetical protein ACOCV1_06530 [Bacillota bacterium]
MTNEQKKQLNEFVEHIRFKHNENMDLDSDEEMILKFSDKIVTLKKVLKKTDDIDIKFMIFELKHELAIMIIEKYNLEKKNPVERLEEKRLNNLKKQKSA